MEKELTKEELEILKKCDGRHETIQEIIECESCAVLLKE